MSRGRAELPACYRRSCRAKKRGCWRRSCVRLTKKLRSSWVRFRMRVRTDIFPSIATATRRNSRILKEKCPNKRGIEMILDAFGGVRATLEDFVSKAGKGEFGAAWIVGGYPNEWVSKELASAAGKIGVTLVQDIFPSQVDGNGGTRHSKLRVGGARWLLRQSSK